MADDTPQTPQPNGIRLMKPGTPGAGIQPTIRLKPIVPRPVAPAAPAPAAPAATPAPAPAPAPAAAAAAPAPAAAPAASPASPPTVRLKPIAPLAKPGNATVNLKPTPTPSAAPAAAEDLTATIQISAPPPVAPAGGLKPAVPLAKPVAPTPAIPVKSDQLQASKSKTSRISLDAALTANNGSAGGPRTIRIKRPTDAPVGKLTSQIPPMGGAAPAAPATPAAPAAAAEAPAAGEPDVPLGQRRTIRVKRPGAPATPTLAKPAEPGANGLESAAAEVVPPEFATDVPPPAFSGFEAHVEKTSPAFPILGIFAIIGFAIAIFFLLKGDANLFNAALWPSPR